MTYSDAEIEGLVKALESRTYETAIAFGSNRAKYRWIKDGNKAAAMLRQLLEERRWQPISEAPKDGTPILVVDVNAKRPVAAFVWWDAPSEWDDEGEGVWRTTEPEIFEVMGGSATFPSPTHWQPLPTPPQDGGD